MYDYFQVSLSSVKITQRTKELVGKVLDEGAIGQSEYIQQFEEMVASFVGSRYCIAVSSGTMADAVACAAMRTYYNCVGAYVPALTFIAQPNSVRYNSMQVNFVDVDRHGMLDFSNINYCEDQLSFFFTNDILGQISYRGNKSQLIVEDACEAFGSTYEGKYAGTFGILGTYSFYPSHTISTGEGGAIVTDDPTLARLCKSIRNHGRAMGDKANWPLHKFDFDNFGFNAKISGVQAAIGISLMENIEEYIGLRKENYKKLKNGLGCGFALDNEMEIVPHGFPIAFKDQSSRDRAIFKLAEAGIESRPFFSSVPNKERYYLQRNQNRRDNFSTACKLSTTFLYLPCHQNLTDSDIEYIFRVFRDILYDKETQL